MLPRGNSEMYSRQCSSLRGEWRSDTCFSLRTQLESVGRRDNAESRIVLLAAPYSTNCTCTSAYTQQCFQGTIPNHMHGTTAPMPPRIRPCGMPLHPPLPQEWLARSS
jgi:hypothetical protein